MEYVHYTAITAVILAALQGFGPRIRARFNAHTNIVSSFGGGVALAYAFLQLFPELDLAHAALGDNIHAVSLAGFFVFYALEIAITRRWSGGHGALLALHQQSPAAAARSFWFHVAIIWSYTWMVMFTVPDEAADSLLFAIVGSLTIGIHLIYKDYVFRRHYEERYQEAGRYVMASAPLAGWIAHQIVRPSEAVLDVFVAILAGVLLQSVFRDELPEATSVKIVWLLAGVVTFALLSTLA